SHCRRAGLVGVAYDPGIGSLSHTLTELLPAEPVDHVPADDHRDDECRDGGQCGSHGDESDDLKSRRLVELLEIVDQVVEHVERVISASLVFDYAMRSFMERSGREASAFTARIGGVDESSVREGLRSDHFVIEGSSLVADDLVRLMPFAGN